MELKIKNLSYTIDLDDIEALITYYRSDRPAPHAQNHDDPNFSDSGDSEEIEYILYWEGRPIENIFPNKIFREIYNYFDDIIIKHARNTLCNHQSL